MTSTAWSADLALNHPEMDHTHEAFMGHLARLEALKEAAAEAILPELEAFELHTQAHFAQEEGWMRELGFDPETCHFSQHRMVLELIGEVKKRVAQQNQTALIAEMVPAILEWFVPHAKNLDGALVAMLAERDSALASAATSAPETAAV